MFGIQIPQLKVLITPQFDAEHHALGLQIDLTIGAPQLEEGTSIVSFPSCPEGSSVKDDIRVFDGQGELPVAAVKNSDGDSGHSWLSGRQTSGDVKLTYSVFPSSSDEFRASGSVVGLHRDQGGLLGSGLAFIAVPPIGKVYHNIVEWDLSEAPEGTRAIWTYGEGPLPIENVGPPSTIIWDSVYMVGPIQSNPPSSMSSSISDYYGYYWFGDLPPNIETIKDIHHDFFLKVSDFFEDAPSAINPYRSFIRNTGGVKSFGGTSFTRSHIFNYDDQISQVGDYDLVRRMAYEMVHVWLGPRVTDTKIDWLYEGIKNCLSIYLPFRNGFRTGHYFQWTICMLCTRYYTNPLVSLPLGEVLELVPTNTYARDLISARGWAFVVGVDLRARRMSELKRPIEDLAIKPLAKNKLLGEPHGIKEWLAYLRPLMGDELDQKYEEFLSGSVIRLMVELFGAKTHYLKRIDQEILEFGMDRRSLDEGVVRGLKKGSRAEEAGLKEGDNIAWSSHQWRCVDHFEEQMEILVEREGVETRVEYWPRTFDKAESWQMIKKEDEE